MAVSAKKNITRLLVDWQQGDKAALDHLLPMVYHELHQIAAGHLKNERRDHTLQATALIHEAYLRMIDQDLPDLQSRAHFFGVASRLMRQILVDHARTNKASKRGGQSRKLSLDDAPPMPAFDDAVELLAFDRALMKLAALDERKSRVVEMRAFGGMSVEDTAVSLGVSVPTIKRDMRLAQAWLRRELGLGSREY
jgi:RNA polymerase sigma-70 factor, ECF subfamily